MATPERKLEDDMVILDRAKQIRKIYQSHPEDSIDEDTEESVITALREAGVDPHEILRRKGKLTRALRLIVHGKSRKPR